MKVCTLYIRNIGIFSHYCYNARNASNVAILKLEGLQRVADFYSLVYPVKNYRALTTLMMDFMAHDTFAPKTLTTLP